ncbi:zinc ribbon domain-containing protein [Ktedonobacter sp. SOSP1-52]|uniref:zinc ribbon domain-containing protein n=1 Tax=Ktedonobacter sp. SOSP1-52 TaxID=2778366 RepID=UPI00191616CA|nr:zinc ribbon domain-containing protein [Ktedonobacter sp. SOSP1-52]
MKCTICREEMEPGAIFCGHCGQRLHSKQEPLSQRQPAPLAIVPGQAGRGITMERPIVHAPLPGPQAASGIEFDLRPGHTGPRNAFVPHHNEMQAKRQYVTRELPEINLARKELSPSALHLALAEPITGLPRGQHNTFFRSMLIFITIALLISSIGVGAYALIKTRSIGGYRLSRDFNSQSRTQVQGEVSFTDDPQTPGKSNRVTITLKQLNAPADNATYQAWLIDDEAEHITPLGQLMPRGTDFVLQRTLGANNLLSLGNRIQVTQESSKVTVPTGKIVFKADFPRLPLCIYVTCWSTWTKHPDRSDYWSDYASRRGSSTPRPPSLKIAHCPLRQYAVSHRIYSISSREREERTTPHSPPGAQQCRLRRQATALAL